MAGDNQGKKTKGRQKIEMKKIENEDDRLITFSKRRSGIYKKASELVTLTGAELAFLVYSPAGKPFSFAHPSMDAITNRFFGQGSADRNNNPTTHPLIEAHRLMRIEELNQQHNELLRQLEIEKEKGKQLKQKHKKNNERKGWWDTPIEELNVPELLQMEAACKEIRTSLINKLKEKTNNGASSAAAAAGGVGGVAIAGHPPTTDHYSAHMINPFASTVAINPNNPSVFTPGFDYGHGQI
ncbi:agamous-like MADS-box protein AGL62 isoform X1 [Ricinus communis]|uniref:Mads box protein, putative n=1 Tax=Ricinus communis TaxID=3988 RepID=B9S145_RICCO|nr:agamous-like MADS-box protein AGL62 isoform X1 [Ricinus communis]EEF42687.1 mads box protein, putative [Ricinus communis]|eukprot:XP_002519714.1 agamous-like MADS-box protein AGL62 [Ricinus communis]